ncbi:MAG: hypothetical protein IPK66_04490 [Rhodospirillales bacterium]|nr:hypothetical protein [Rhodospirillales bacterium]
MPMRRIAVPMIGGMVSSTGLTLIVIPAIYGLIKGLRLPPGGTDSDPQGRATKQDSLGRSTYGTI